MSALTQGLSKKEYDEGEKMNIVLFSLGKLTSVFGSSIYTFAIGLYVLQQTGSGLSFAVTLVLGTIPMVIINPFAGVLADRGDKKKLVVGMDLANGILFLSLFFLTAMIGMHLGLIYISTLVMSIFTAIFSISLEAAKPNIVKQSSLMSINSISKIIDSLASILGPMVGGIIFALIDIRLFILFNGVSFIISGISEIFINFKLNNHTTGKPKKSIKFTEDIMEGFMYIKGVEGLMKLISTFIFLNLFLGFSITVPLPFIINNILLLDSSYYGIVQAGFPVGMIIGAIIVKKIRERMDYNRILNTMCLLLSILMVLIGLPLVCKIILVDVIYLIYYSLISLASGVTIALIDIPLFYELQTIIPEEYRGRVLSIAMAIAKAVLPIALIASGVLINKLPAALLPIAGGISLFFISKTVLKDIA